MEVGGKGFTTELVRSVRKASTDSLGNAAYMKRYQGTVATVDAPNNVVSVTLMGGSTPSTGFRVRGLQMPLVGQRVMVGIDGQDRWVESVLRSAGDPYMTTSSGGVPTGTVLLWPTASAPGGYLLCDGSSVLQASYPTLFAVIGTTFGSVDGAHFTLPDMRGRFPLGKAASGTGSALAGTGGSIDHSHTGPSHSHAGPWHGHGLGGHTHTDPAHQHEEPFALDGPSGGIWFYGGGTFGRGGTTYSGLNSRGTITSTNVSTTFSLTNTAGGGQTGGPSGGSDGAGNGQTDASGTGATGASNPPFLALNYIIKA